MIARVGTPQAKYTSHGDDADDYDDTDDFGDDSNDGSSSSDSHAACLKNQPGFCIDVNTEECDGAQVKTGFCSGAGNIKCCPTSKVKGADNSKTGYDDDNGGDDGTTLSFCELPRPSKKKLAGTCIDTNEKSCYGASVVSGYCPGAAQIKCCPRKGTPTSSSNDDYYGFGYTGGTDEAGGEKTVVACNKGQSGSCVDTEAQTCNGATFLTGYCDGAANIKCCPSPGKAAVIGGDATNGDDYYGYDLGGVKPSELTPCIKGIVGSCIDVETQECVGEKVATGFCAGNANIKCCPKPALVVNMGGEDNTKDGDDLSAYGFGGYFDYDNDAVDESACLKGKEGTCIDTMARVCDGADVLTGFCSGAAHIKCCPTPGASKAVGKVSIDSNPNNDDGAADVDHSKCYVSEDGGRCIDTNIFSCSGAATVTGLCPGSASIRCCPGAGEPEPIASDTCSFVPVIVTMKLLHSEEQVTELVMKQSYRINTGSLLVAGGNDWWSIVVPPSKPSKPSKGVNVGPNGTTYIDGIPVAGGGSDKVGETFSEVTAISDAESSKTWVAALVVIVVLLLAAVGAAFFIFKHQQSAQRLMIPTSAVLMNAAYRPGQEQPPVVANTGGFVFQSTGTNGGPIYAIPMDDELPNHTEVKKPRPDTVWVNSAAPPEKTNLVTQNNWLSKDDVTVAANNGTIYSIPMEGDVVAQRPHHSSSMV